MCLKSTKSLFNRLSHRIVQEVKLGERRNSYLRALSIWDLHLLLLTVLFGDLLTVLLGSFGTLLGVGSVTFLFGNFLTVLIINCLAVPLRSLKHD